MYCNTAEKEQRLHASSAGPQGSLCVRPHTRNDLIIAYKYSYSCMVALRVTCDGRLTTYKLETVQIRAGIDVYLSESTTRASANAPKSENRRCGKALDSSGHRC